MGACGHCDVGRTTDLAAAKAGLGSGKTYVAAKRVVENGTAKLVEAMDLPPASHFQIGRWDGRCDGLVPLKPA